MKTLLCISVILYSFFGLSQTTSIGFRPTEPVNCKKSNAPHVNWIYMIAKTNETSDAAEFSILAQDGYCRDQDFHESELNGKDMALVIAENSFIIPWEGEPATVSYEVLPTNVLRARFNFDKVRLFGRNPTRPAKAVFYMFYYPAVNEGLMYKWRVVLTNDPGQGLEMQVTSESAGH